MPINEQQMEDLICAFNNMSAAVRSISHGDSKGPLGLEAISMAISGDGAPGVECLTDAIKDSGMGTKDGLESIADSISQLSGVMADHTRAVAAQAKAMASQADAQHKIAGWLPTLIAVLNKPPLSSTVPADKN